MKKILILSLILLVSFTSMNFRGCQEETYKGLILSIAIMGGLRLAGDNSTTEKYAIYVGENGGIMRSSGESNIIFELKTSGTTERLNNVRVSPFIANETVIAVGNNGTIVSSTNSGNNWSVSAPLISANLYGVDFSNPYCYAVGDNGSILLSANSSSTWLQITSGTNRNLKAVGYSPQSNTIVVTVGEKGTILRSTNIGLTWTNISLTDTTINFYGISQKGPYYTSGNNFCIVGTGGKIFKSTDGGATWLQKPSGTTNTLRSIYFHTVDSAIVVGDNGTIRFSTNGGETWFTDAFFNSPSTRQYKSVTLINRDHYTFSALSDSLFFVSNDPITIGLNPISLVIPKGFSISQNYPNPFNPSTKIKFEIPISPISFGERHGVRLVIFDILGREVETLINEQLKPGTYEVDWNAAGYSSGIYFYKLIAGDFTETKRMVLIK